MTTPDQSDSTVADLMTDGCNMGIKALSKYLNEYTGADDRSKQICSRMIADGEKLEKKLRLCL